MGINFQNLPPLKEPENLNNNANINLKLMNTNSKKQALSEINTQNRLMESNLTSRLGKKTSVYSFLL